MSNNEEIKELQELLKEDSSNFQARRRLAVLLLDNGFNEDALKQFLFLISVFPSDANLYYNLGIVYEKIKKLELAKNAYIKALEISPNDTDCLYNLGLVHIDLKDYTKAIEVFGKVIETDKDDSNCYFNLGLCYTKLQNHQKAIEYFKKTIEINGMDVFARFYLGNHYKTLNQIDLAKKEFEKVIELSPDYSWAYFNLGSINFDEGDFENAIKNLKITIKLNPKDISAYKIYSKILIKLDLLDKAQKLIQNAITKNIYEGDLYYILSQIHKLKKDFELYEKALKLALKNYHKLSYSPKLIKNELDNLKKGG